MTATEIAERNRANGASSRRLAEEFREAFFHSIGGSAFFRDIESSDPPALHLRRSIHIIDGQPNCGCRVIKRDSPWSGCELIRIDLCEEHTREKIVYVEKPVEKKPVEKKPVEKKPAPEYPPKRKIMKD